MCEGSAVSEQRFPFQLRGAEGSVSVSFQSNEGPERWGYGVLGLEWPIELAAGLPVLTARTECALEGYAAIMLQFVRCGSAHAHLLLNCWFGRPAKVRSKQRITRKFLQANTF